MLTSNRILATQHSTTLIQGKLEQKGSATAHTKTNDFSEYDQEVSTINAKARAEANADYDQEVSAVNAKAALAVTTKIATMSPDIVYSSLSVSPTEHPQSPLGKPLQHVAHRYADKQLKSYEKSHKNLLTTLAKIERMRPDAELDLAAKIANAKKLSRHFRVLQQRAEEIIAALPRAGKPAQQRVAWLVKAEKHKMDHQHYENTLVALKGTSMRP